MSLVSNTINLVGNEVPSLSMAFFKTLLNERSDAHRH